jgi:hypothetical protein
MPAVVISLEAVRVDNAILLDYLTTEVALEQPDIGSTDPNLLIDSHCTYEDLQFGMPGDSGDCEDYGEDSDERDAISTNSRRRRPVTELQMFDLGTRDICAYGGEDGDDTDEDVDKEAEPSQSNDGSTQNVVD